MAALDRHPQRRGLFARATPKSRRDRMASIKLGDFLVEKGLITGKQLEIALIHQKVTGELLGDVLVKLGFISSKERTQILAEQTGMEFFDLGRHTVTEEALTLVPKAVAEKNEFLPLEEQGGRLSIGITSPGNMLAIDTVSALPGISRKYSSWTATPTARR